MPAPGAPTYAAAAKVAAQTSFRDLIDSGAGPGTIKIRSAADALLATITLADPCGSVNGTTGQLTLTAASTPNASATGTAAYAEVCNSTGTVYLALDTQAGSSPVSGKLVLSTLSLVAGTPVELLGATIG
jgi:hypothetical protein